MSSSLPLFLAVCLACSIAALSAERTGGGAEELMLALASPATLAPGAAAPPAAFSIAARMEAVALR